MLSQVEGSSLSPYVCACPGRGHRATRTPEFSGRMGSPNSWGCQSAPEVVRTEENILCTFASTMLVTYIVQSWGGKRTELVLLWEGARPCLPSCSGLCCLTKRLRRANSVVQSIYQNQNNSRQGSIEIRVHCQEGQQRTTSKRGPQSGWEAGDLERWEKV